MRDLDAGSPQHCRTQRIWRAGFFYEHKSADSDCGGRVGSPGALPPARPGVPDHRGGQLPARSEVEQRRCNTCNGPPVCTNAIETRRAQGERCRGASAEG
jgi:hypothetical protein